MTTITPEQRQAAVEAGDSPVELADPQTGITYILVRAEVYRRMQEHLEADEDRREHHGDADVADTQPGERDEKRKHDDRHADEMRRLVARVLVIGRVRCHLLFDRFHRAARHFIYNSAF